MNIEERMDTVLKSYEELKKESRGIYDPFLNEIKNLEDKNTELTKEISKLNVEYINKRSLGDIMGSRKTSKELLSIKAEIKMNEEDMNCLNDIVTKGNNNINNKIQDLEEKKDLLRRELVHLNGEFIDIRNDLIKEYEIKKEKALKDLYNKFSSVLLLNQTISTKSISDLAKER